MTKLFLIFTIWTLIVVTAAGQPCRFGRPGAGCRYNCNCAGSCDRQTGCAGNCATGWDGPTCQRLNAALNQHTSQSSNYLPKYSSELAVDGKVGHHLENTPCTHTKLGSRGWWTVTLDRKYSIYRFQIYNRYGSCSPPAKQCGSRLNGFILSVGTNNRSYRTCYTDTTTSNNGPGDIINGRCDDGNPRTGNTVRISLPSSTPLTLCEVRLFVCSEGWYGEMCDKECVTDTRCSRCDDHRLWCEKCVNGRWGADCGRICTNCWNNTACDMSTRECLNPSPRCKSGFEGDSCTIHCRSHRWGPDCKETCGQCHGGAVCDRVSGDCPPGNPRCTTGYTGRRCTSCDSGSWGDNCVNTCGGNCNSPACNVTTGVCEGGCHPGYTGQRCDTVCPPGSWGNHCVRTCSEYCLEQPCNAQTGACEGGCQPGQAGKFCETKFQAVNYTAVIIGCVVGVILAAAVITAVVICVRRRQSGQSQGSAVYAENTGVTHDATNTGIPNRTQGPSTEPVTYNNMTPEVDHPYEIATENEYAKIQFS